MFRARQILTTETINLIINKAYVDQNSPAWTEFSLFASKSKIWRIPCSFLLHSGYLSQKVKSFPFIFLTYLITFCTKSLLNFKLVTLRCKMIVTNNYGYIICFSSIILEDICRNKAWSNCSFKLCISWNISYLFFVGFKEFSVSVN